MAIDERKSELIKNACLVFSKYDGKALSNGNDYANSLRPIREQAKELGITLDELHSIYLERKKVIDEANSVFAMMNDRGKKDYNALAIRLRALREKAKSLDIDLSMLWKKQNDLNDMLDSNTRNVGISSDISTVKLSDPITEEYCEGFLKSFLKYSSLESRFTRLDTTKERGRDDLSGITGNLYKKMSYEVMLNSLRIAISKIRNNNLDGLNEWFVLEVKRIGIDNFNEYLTTGKTTNEAVNDFLSSQLKNNYDMETEHVGMYSSSFPFKPKDIDATTHNRANNIYRIYLNIPITNMSVNFMTDFCNECQKQGIAFDTKLFFNGRDTNLDRTIIYSTFGDLNQKINILKNLLEKYKGIEFGSPPSSCAKIEGLDELGISHLGGCTSPYKGSSNDSGIKLNNHHSYNDYINGIINKALCRVIDDFGYTNSFSESFRNNMSRFKNGVARGVLIENDDINHLKDIVKEILNDESLKRSFLSQFCEYIHQEHNKENDYSILDNKNVALDTWFTDEVKARYSRGMRMSETEIKK